MAENQNKPIKMQLPDKKIASKIISSKGDIVKDGNSIHNGNYSSSNVISFPITKNSQFAGSGANVTMTQPMFFSPLHTPQNWQIASKRKEVYQWARHYYENEPKVAAGIDFYSQFPINGFKLECKKKSVLKFFERLVEKTDMMYWLRMISHQRFLLGDVYVMTEIECPHCKGTGINEDDETCNHPDGTIGRITVLNPDWIEVMNTPISQEPQIVLLPDEEIQKIIQTKQPKFLYDQIPDNIKMQILAKKPILLSNRVTSHIKHGGVPYGTYGESLLRRLFTSLAYKTKLMTANWIVAERLILPVRVVKVGSDERPADDEAIADVSSQLSAVANDPNLTIVTHNNFEYEWYGACQDNLTQILTVDGWKLFKDIDKDAVVATYNKDLGCMQWQQIQKYHEYDFKSTDTLKMIDFKSRGVDIRVTPNHRMLVQRNGEWIEVLSQEVKHGDEFLNKLDWHGSFPEKLQYKDSPLSHLSLDNYLQFVGYYLSEGGVKRDTKRNLSLDKQIQACSVGQNRHSPIYSSMKEVVELVYPNFSEAEDDRGNDTFCNFTINNVKIARYMAEEFGSRSEEKKIPRWILDLPKEKLKIVYDAMMAGDGSVRHDNLQPRYKYTTTSLDLSNGFTELVLKLGYFSYLKKESGRNINCRDIYRIYWSDCRLETPFEIRNQHISRTDYDGKVYCVTVPNGFIITRRNGRITVQGNSGKIHNINQELEYVGKEILDGLMLNQTLLNGEMAGYNCHDESTLTLTDSGFKNWQDITENDKIGCYNPDTKCLEYHNYTAKHVYDHDGEMIQFSTDKIDVCVTPNHRMWSAKRDSDVFEFIEAQNVKSRASFVGTVDGFIGEEETIIKIGLNEIPIYQYCELVGFFVSEGSTSKDHRRIGERHTIHISQSPCGKASEAISSCLEKSNIHAWRSENEFNIWNPSLAEHFYKECGRGAINKCLPSWIKNFSPEYLEIIIKAMIQGDGCTHLHENRKAENFAYYTSSKQLGEDFAEIAFKCGYVVKLVESKPKTNKKRYFNKTGHEFITKHQQYVVYISKGFKGREPSLSSKSKKYAGKEIERKSYKGKVYCFTVPHGLFVTMRNGKITIQGNSAQVGVEVMIRRLESWRNELAQWIEKHIFLPVAKMQGFVDEEVTKEYGETEYLYPRVKWDDLRLRDNTNQLQMFLQMQQSGLISSQTLLEMFDLDYDREIERIREEQVQAMQNGMLAGGGGQQMGGGAPGGMGGGGMGGGGDPMGGMGGAPGMDPSGGMGGGMGGAPGGGMDMGGGMGGAGGGMGGGMGAAASASPQKIYRKGKGPKDDDKDMQPVRPTTIQLTKPESKMYRTLTAMNLPFRLFAQYKQPVPNDSNFYLMDFAIPQLGVDIEVDGEKWHSSVEDKQKDKERDLVLASLGWRVLRFTEQAIGEQLGKVQQVIEKEVFDAAKEKKSISKKAKSLNQAKYKTGHFSPFEGCYISKYYLLDNEVKEG